VNGAGLAREARVDSLAFKSVLSISALLLASACSAGAQTAPGNGGDTSGGNGSPGGSIQAGGTTASGVSCPSASSVVASTSGYSSNVAVAGSYVYIEENDATNGGGGALNGTFVRVPLGGGAAETLDEEGAGVFAANDAGVAAWTHPSTGGNPLVGVYVRDASGQQQTLTLPMGAQYVNSLAVDAAGNVFALVNMSTGGTNVYRYSVVRQSFDMLHHNLAGLQGFYKDGTGVAWIGPDTSGNPALFREDVLGGPPAEGPSLPNNDSQIAGIDAKAVYQMQGNTIHAIDRASGADTVAFDISADPMNSYAYVGSVAVDDQSFYWVSQGSSGSISSVMRVSKTLGGTPTTVASADQIGTIALGSCSLVYLSGTGGGAWSVVARPK
jgi:hypothetical protein